MNPVFVKSPGILSQDGNTFNDLNSTIDKHITIKGIMFIYKNLIK